MTYRFNKFAHNNVSFLNVWWHFFIVDREFVDQSPGHHEAVWLWQRHYRGTLPRLQLVCSQEINGGRWGKKCKKWSSPRARIALCYRNISTSLTSWHRCPPVGSFCCKICLWFMDCHNNCGNDYMAWEKYFAVIILKSLAISRGSIHWFNCFVN